MNKLREHSLRPMSVETDRRGRATRQEIMKTIVLLGLVLVLVGCKGPYENIEKEFPAGKAKAGAPVDATYITLVSRNYRGAFNYDGVLTVSRTDDAVILVPRAPFSIFQGSLRIPTTAVTGCSMTCFGMDDRRVDLLLGKQGTEISFDAPKAMLDWCWRTSRPMITGKQEREWLYLDKDLPEFKNYVQVPRKEYEKQACRACAGY